MIDTHSHLNFKAFNQVYAEVVQRSFNNGILKIINVGAKLDSSQRAVDLTQEFENLYSAVGLHPIHVNPTRNLDINDEVNKINQDLPQKLNNFNDYKISNGVNDEELNIGAYRELAQRNKVVAIGEIGLDYFYGEDRALKEKQKIIFQQFIQLAQEQNLPLILHCRSTKEEPDQAYNDMLELLEKYQYFNGVIHCFTGSPLMAKKFLELGFYVGFTGVITFASELAETVASVPLDKILLETDCPYMSPEPHRRERCEPWYVKFTAQKIAEIKNIDLEQVLEQTTFNAINLFNF
jgi:TatD DNase family protein